MKAPRQILIDGKEYPYDGLTDNRLGVISADQVFWMKPVCFGDGSPVVGSDYLTRDDFEDGDRERKLPPPFGPREIHRITFRVPDLTVKFSDELEDDRKRVITVWKERDFIAHFARYPRYDYPLVGVPYDGKLKDLISNAWPSSFEKYRQSRLAREILWERHGSPELAHEYGYRAASELPLHYTLRQQTMGRILPDINFEALYPDGCILYLADLIADRLPSSGLVGEHAATRPNQVSGILAVVEKLDAAGNQAANKVLVATQKLQKVQKDLQPTLNELDTHHARLEALMEEHKLKENPRQTRRALVRHGISERLVDFVMSYLIVGKPIPKAPTAARMLQKKYATKEGLDRRTVDRHFKIVVPILRAAGWPEQLLPVSKVAGRTNGPKVSVNADARTNNAPTDSIHEIEDRESGETLSPFERSQQCEQEGTSLDRP